MYEFELEKNSKKHSCPRCNQTRFVRYVKRTTNETLSFETGRCDRESSCGYHLTPKMFFEENKNLRKPEKTCNFNQFKTPTQTKSRIQKVDVKKTDFIPHNYLLKSLANDQNNFVQFLYNLFPEDIEEVQKALKNYFIGTIQNKTIFWQIDKGNRIRTGKIIAYDKQTGKRDKSIYPNWVHARLKKKHLIKQDFYLKQCFFGEHLVWKDSNKTICIVEAEKTAVIASICFPENVWLAIGSKQSLKFDRLKRLGRNRKIILYPDADGFNEWNKAIQTAQSNGFDVTISKVIHTHTDEKERSNGLDLADYLIDQQSKINEQNKLIDSINEKLLIVKNDKSLLFQFNTILDEQKAILIIDGKHSAIEAERLILHPQNVREIVLSLV